LAPVHLALCSTTLYFKVSEGYYKIAYNLYKVQLDIKDQLCRMMIQTLTACLDTKSSSFTALTLTHAFINGKIRWTTASYLKVTNLTPAKTVIFIHPYIIQI